MLHFAVRLIQAARTTSLAAAAAFTFTASAPAAAAAQTAVAHVMDATVAPRGVVRLRAVTQWTRYEQLFGVGPDGRTPVPLGALLGRDALGADDLPFLSTAEDAARTLAADPALRVSLGQLRARANSRLVTTPILLEYGATQRVTVSFTMPIVQTRTNLVAELNPESGHADLGPNPARLLAAALSANAALVNQVNTAAQQLQTQLTQCRANPAAPGCAALLAREAEAETLISASLGFADGVVTLYGVSAASPGQPFVPLAGTDVQAQIDSRLDGFRQQYQEFLGGDPITGAIRPALAPAALAQLHGIFTSPEFGILRDTLGRVDRYAIGDLEFGVTVQLADSYTPAAEGFQYRAAGRATLRVPTAQQAFEDRAFDIGTGGDLAVEAAAASDLRFGRWAGATVAGRYLVQLGTRSTTRIPGPDGGVFPLTPPIGGTWRPGNEGSFELTPRLLATSQLALHGHYGFHVRGADTYQPDAPLPFAGAPGLRAWSAQRVGFGLSYSTVAGAANGARVLPIEASYSHIQTIAADGGPVPQARRDLVQVRFYYDLLGAIRR